MKEDPAVYVAHLLFSRVGMRNIEIVNARTHWISDGSIGIINRPEENFFPKGCEGWVPIAPDVLARNKAVRIADKRRVSCAWTQSDGEAQSRLSTSLEMDQRVDQGPGENQL